MEKREIMFRGVSIKQEHLNHTLSSFEQALTKGKLSNKTHCNIILLSQNPGVSGLSFPKDFREQFPSQCVKGIRQQL